MDYSIFSFPSKVPAQAASALAAYGDPPPGVRRLMSSVQHLENTKDIIGGEHRRDTVSKGCNELALGDYSSATSIAPDRVFLEA